MTENSKKIKSSSSLVVMVMVGVLIGWLTGFAVGNNISADDTSAASTEQVATIEDEKTDMHEHEKTIEADPQNAPTVTLMVQKDSMSGYNVQVVTTNFKFTPENANQEDVANEGHAHIYVDGEKIGRVYGEWYHLADQGEGKKEITVSLNGNSHATFTVNGEKVEDTVIVADDGHAHDAEDADHSHN